MLFLDDEDYFVEEFFEDVQIEALEQIISIIEKTGTIVGKSL